MTYLEGRQSRQHTLFWGCFVHGLLRLKRCLDGEDVWLER
jgi:hypothetical protein